MIRFTLRAAGLGIFSLALLLAARLIGNAQPTPENVAVFHLSDCHLPCWIGITPGKTTLGEARQRVKQVYGNLSNYTLSEDSPGIFRLRNKRDSGGLSGFGFSVESPADTSVVRVTSLWEDGPLQDLLSMGWLHSIAGAPAYLTIDMPRPVTGYIPTLFFPVSGIIASLGISDCARVTPESPTLRIDIYPTLLSAKEFGGRSWRGFGACNRLPGP